MDYSIGQVSQMLELPISTLRYYDKEGLLPGPTPDSHPFLTPLLPLDPPA